MTAPRKNIMLGTAGHVDHGKTALAKLLTGCDLDRLAVEQQRGLTIELGFAPVQMADKRIVGIVDVPGHMDFIRNMVAGAQGVDVVILVVAADDGVMPQTREHLDILTLMGVRHGLVAVTKIDLVEADLREIVVEEIAELLDGTFLAGAPVCGVSNVTGEGFDAFFAALNEAVAACRPREDPRAFRLWIERSFPIRGFGTVVSGIPASGEVHVGERLRLLPDGLSVRVRGMEVYGEAADVARAGECVALNLADADAELLTRGKVLCADEGFEPVGLFEADLTLLPGAGRPLKDYAEVHVHVGTGEAMGHVAMLEGEDLAPGAHQLVQLRLRDPLGVAAGERFVIRTNMAALAGGRVTTVGGGRILGTSNLRLRRKRPWTIEMLSARRAAIDSPAGWCGVCLREAGEAVSDDALARRAQMPAGRVAEYAEQLVADGTARRLPGGELVHADVLARTREAILAALIQFHDANPMRLGMERSQLAGQLATAPPLLAAALAGLVEAGKLTSHGEVLAVPGCGANLSAEDRALLERVEATLQQAHLAPPTPETLAADLGAPLARIEEMLRLLVDAGTVLRLDRKVAMHRDAVAAAEEVVLDLFRQAPSFETVQFRDAVGVSRKFAVPLLDYFDTAKLTVRSASRRRPGLRAREALGKG